MARILEVDKGSRSSRLIPAVAIGAAGLGMALFNRVRASRAERGNPPLGRFVDVGRTRLHYLVKGEGAPIVLLHGNGSLIQDWLLSGVMDELSRTNRVIAFDRPGFGHSTRPALHSWTPQAQAEVLAKAMEQLEIGQATVVGHSFATQIALALVLDHRQLVSRLVLISGYYYATARFDVALMAGPAVPVVGAVMRHTLSPLIGKAMEPMVNRKIFEPAEVPQKWKDGFPVELALRPSQLRAVAQDSAVMVPAAAKLSRSYGQLDLPVTIIAGDGDRIADPHKQSARLHEEVRHSRMVLLPGIGHMAHQLAPAAIVEAILDQERCT